jgi:NAD(P)-dependent dehydrogenase (short-subunit alcohol dehydrogenase family)
METIDLDGKTAWITGASSGIGRAVAKQMAGEGADLILTARREEKLQSLADECTGVKTTVAPMDVTDRDRNKDVVQTIRDEHGKLDVAFFNAGVYSDMPDAINPETFERDFNVNVLGMVYGIDAALPLLRESDHGRIVAMSSATAYGPLPRASSYGASKAAVKYMIESLRFEWDHKNVDVGLSVVCPGFVKTPLTEQNSFPMPLLMELDQASDIIVRGIKSGKQEIGFPLGLVLPLKLANTLPAFLYNPIIKMVTGMA